MTVTVTVTVTGADRASRGRSREQSEIPLEHGPFQHRQVAHRELLETRGDPPAFPRFPLHLSSRPAPSVARSRADPGGIAMNLEPLVKSPTGLDLFAVTVFVSSLVTPILPVAPLGPGRPIGSLSTFSLMR